MISRKYRGAFTIAIWGILFFSIGFGFNYYRQMQVRIDKVIEIPISEVDLNGKQDGVYNGEYTFEIMYAKVAVTVKDEKITDIQLLEHKADKGGNKAASIVPQIVKEQSVQVDDVTKATDSSRIIKLAVLDALK